MPAAAPARTDIKGLGDGSMKIDRIRVTAARDIAHRAPNFSPEQAAAMLCASQKGGFGVERAKRMHSATVEASRARDAWDAGTGLRKDWEKAELKRQDAVISYMVPVPILNMMVGPGEKKSGMPKPEFGALRIETPDLFSFKENGKEVIAVTGVIHNTGALRLELPPLTLRAIDEWDFSIAGQTSLLPFEALNPGESRRFEIRFLNPPAYTVEVYVHFAPPFMYRSPRDCDFFDPATFNADAASLDAPAGGIAREIGADGKPAYTAGELNLLTLFFRREAEAAWRCQNVARDTCSMGSGSQRLYWRDMFAMSEAIDEAWVALRAAEETRKRVVSGAEVETAEAAREAAMGRVMALGAKALARAGASAGDVEVAVTVSSYGLDADGLFVEIAGTVHNAGAAARKVDALMVAFVDRRELALSSLAVEVGLQLAPGETQAFSQRLQAGQGGRGRSRNMAPARIPPRDIPWQVRVGAMARE